MRFIDAHVHVWTSDTSHYPLAPGFTRADMTPRSFTPEDLFKHTTPNGVQHINLIQMSFYGFDNRYMLDMMDLHKDFFSGTAVIDPLQKEPERQMVDLAKRRVRAFRIHPRLSRLPAARWLEPAGYTRMFSAGARHNLALSCLIGPDGLPELDRMCRKFPDTPVIIDHLCRLGAEGTIAEQGVKALCAMAAHKRVHVKVGAFYALGGKKPLYQDLAPMIERVVKAFGARRCMWESDCPFQLAGGHSYRDSIGLVRTGLKFLSAADRDWLLRRTAQEFFFNR